MMDAENAENAENAEIDVLSELEYWKKQATENIKIAMDAHDFIRWIKCVLEANVYDNAALLEELDEFLEEDGED